MKFNKLIYTAAFTFAMLSPVTAVWANGTMGDAKISHLINSAAIPNNAIPTGATHKIEVHVQGKPLAGLSITIPDEVKIDGGIEVKNQSGEKIPATVSINNKQAKISFSQPVEPDTKLSILMKDVVTPGYAETWLYRTDAKIVGFNEEIPLGISQIQTYGD